ncbi:hypothetical protein GPECTOR_74g698 [Gonium pectorale]|uniref:HYR domain-containing protein n=1 Tax=Gonium pectorale TaxID=33097 RepID=A0A150G2N9_GONPE|nr:hypothetical protein GPECTOR_74g698 [Gonium pectorale]|eukprot:KXZ44084.1 hypothetical protein GPECTOR_74g698 [Gonium pectorale]
MPVDCAPAPATRHPQPPPSTATPPRCAAPRRAACSEESPVFTTRFESCPLLNVVSEGCFADAEADGEAGRLVPLPLTAAASGGGAGGGLTVASCAVAALDAGQNLFAVQAGSLCFGGTNLTRAKSLGEVADCSPCSGDSQQQCGGSLRNSVYSFAYKAVCTTDVDAAGVEVGSEAVPSLAECRRRCAARSDCTFVVYTGDACSYRTSFLTGSGVGASGPADSSTVCPVRPTEDKYLCVWSWDVQGRLVSAERAEDKAACRGRCSALGWSCTHFSFVGSAIASRPNCFLKVNMLRGTFGGTRPDFGLETCVKVAEQPDVCSLTPNPCGDDPAAFTACLSGTNATVSESAGGTSLATAPDVWGSWRCNCAAGYYYHSELRKCLAANCTTGVQPCGSSGTCTTLDANSYSCACRRGFFFDAQAKTCLENKCVSSGTNPCGAPRAALSCIPVSVSTGAAFEPDYKCLCKPGYFFDALVSKTCQRSPCAEASPSPCGELGTFTACTPVNATDVMCSCAAGYVYDEQARKCLRDMCATSPCGGPDMYDKCTSYNGTSYSCTCKPGYFYETHKKAACVRSICTKAANPCGPSGSICNAVTATKYTCTCPPSYVFDDFSKTCMSDPCFDADKTCGGAGKYTSCNAFNATAWTCACTAGHYFDPELKLCKADPCTASPSPCGPSEAFSACALSPEAPTYTCACRPGFKFINATCQRVDDDTGPCAAKPCGNSTASSRCTPAEGSSPPFVCACNSPAYLFDGTLNTCAANPCARPDPCGPATTGCIPHTSTEWSCTCALGHFFNAAARICTAGSCAAQPNPCGAVGTYVSCNPIAGADDFTCNLCAAPVNPCGVGATCTPTSGTTYDCACPPGQSFDQVTRRCLDDTTPPVLTTPTSVVVEATAAQGAVVLFTATAYDPQSGPLTPTCSVQSGLEFPLTGAGAGTQVVCSATDAARNTVTKAFRIRVVDTTPPSFEPIPNILLESADPSGMTVDFADRLNASDAVSGATVSCTPASGSFFPVGEPTKGTCSFAGQEAGGAGTGAATCVEGEGGALTAIDSTTVVCTATDGFGNLALRSFTVTVVKPTPPVFTAGLEGVVVDATDATGAVVSYALPTALDALSPTDAAGPGTATVSCWPESGTKFSIGTTPVTCTARDALGVEASATFPVTVTCTWTSRAFAGSASLGTPLPPFDETGIAAGGLYPISRVQVDQGAFLNGIRITYEGANATAVWRGGSAGPLQPQLALRSGEAITDVSVGTASRLTYLGVTTSLGRSMSWAGSSGEAGNATLASAKPAAAPACAPPGTTPRLAAVEGRAADTGSGAVLQSLAFVWCWDATPSLILPDDMLVEAPGAQGAAVSYSAATTNDAAFSCEPPSGSVFPVGFTQVVCTMAGGLQGSFRITVADPTPPVFSPAVLPDVRVTASSAQGAAVGFGPFNATDEMSGPPLVTCEPPANSFFPIGETLVTCTAADRVGLTSAATFAVTVERNPGALPDPVLSLPSGLTVEGLPGALTTRVQYAVAVSEDVPFSCSPPSGAPFPVGETTNVTCSLDGYPAAAWFLVTVAAPAPPAFTRVPPDVALDATSPRGAVVNFTAAATDALSGPPTVECDPPSGFTFPHGVTTVTCVATDGIGLQASASFTVAVGNPCGSTPSPCGPPEAFLACSNTAGGYDFSCDCAIGYIHDSYGACNKTSQLASTILTGTADQKCLDAVTEVNCGSAACEPAAAGGKYYALACAAGSTPGMCYAPCATGFSGDGNALACGSSVADPSLFSAFSAPGASLDGHMCHVGVELAGATAESFRVPLQGASVAPCAYSCALRPGCVAGALVKTETEATCLLKSSIQADGALRNASQHSVCFIKPSAYDNYICVANITTSGDELATLVLPSGAACAAECQARPDCVSFNHATATCKLQSSILRSGSAAGEQGSASAAGSQACFKVKRTS